MSNLRPCIAFWLVSNSRHSPQSVTSRSNLYELFLLYSKLLCCLDISAALLKRTKLFQYLEYVYLIFSCFLVCQDKTGRSNVCEEAEVLVKVDAVFFIISKPDYRYFLQLLEKVYRFVVRSKKQLPRNALPSLKYLSIELLREMGEDASLYKL